MAPENNTLTTRSESSTPYQLDPSQTLRAATALLKKLQTDEASLKTKTEKQDLLADNEDEVDAEIEGTPVWLNVTTKKHIVDKKSLKPGKIALPHPLQDASSPNFKICLITADPQRQYKDLIDQPSFPSELRERIGRVIGLEKLKAKYKSFESRRQLFGEYDMFLADDRVIIHLPGTLGKVFYAGGAKRPVPVVLMGRKEDKNEKGEKRVPLAQGGTKAIRQPPNPATLAKEIERAVSAALIHLSPGTQTSVKVGHAGMEAQQIAENVDAVVAGLTKQYISKGWRNVRGLHIKGPRTAALPIWLADELWENDKDVLEHEPEETKKVTGGKKKDKKRKRALEQVPADEVELAHAQGEGKAKKSRKSIDSPSEEVKEKAQKDARKEALKRQKLEARKAVAAA